MLFEQINGISGVPAGKQYLMVIIFKIPDKWNKKCNLRRVNIINPDLHQNIKNVFKISILCSLTFFDKYACSEYLHFYYPLFQINTCTERKTSTPATSAYMVFLM